MLVRKIGYAKGTERGLGRKIREAILARRLEYTLSKEDILYLYLNEIYLGAGVYGVQAAAESYFAKFRRRPEPGEMSLLAGLPPAPSRYSPIKNPKAARTKQAYVLSRMVEEGYISVDEMKAAKAGASRERTSRVKRTSLPMWHPISPSTFVEIWLKSLGRTRSSNKEAG